ncbi:MAG TPA: hypothetical protein VL405_06195 [Sphingomonas sp.]|jgi:hypothetical protein|nr:hypothetical protein [Sphingomonas sp.]
MSSDHITTGAEDFPAHVDGYSRFLFWLKTGTIASVIAAAVVIFLITR